MSDPTTHTAVTMPDARDDAVAARAEALFTQQDDAQCTQIDRAFSWLLVAEWLGVIAVAALLSPPAAARWAGMPDLVAAAVLLGALVALPAQLMARRHPGARATRHMIGVAQMLLGTLLIHVTAGRIETHFYLFGSLAFLAFYRDWRVLATASAVVFVDHLLRGTFFPESVYGVAFVTVWRTVEHGFWVVFEDTFLVILCHRGQREKRAAATQHALLEQKRHAEAERERALESSRVKSEFLANMSHEIRTPMTAIQGYTELLLDPSLPQRDRLEYLHTVQRNGDHLMRLINGILDLSKIEAGKLTVERIPCAPAQLVVDVTSLMRVRAAEKSLDFAVDFATPVPALIQSDPTRLRQILLNLVGNAIKFTERGSVWILVRCDDPEASDPHVSFEVADTGIGLDKEQIDRLFLPFSQADSSTTRKYGGSGLGLSIAKRLAALLGGDITIESLVGRGTSFTLRIPTGPLRGVEMLSNLREAGVAHAPSPGATTTALTRISARVLLAEDGVDNQVLVATHLRRAGADVTVADNGRIALDLARGAAAGGRPFDVILMDMQMPEMDGYTATTALRKDGYRGPIVALTAHAMQGDRDVCIAAGCDDYLTKPIDKGVLLGTVAHYAERSSAEDVVSDTIRAPAGPSSSGDVPLVSELADDPDIADVIAAFVGVLAARGEAILTALRLGDTATLRRLVHQLKGAAGSHGFYTITDQAAHVEEALAEGNAAHVDSQAHALAALCFRAARGARSETRLTAPTTTSSTGSGAGRRALAGRSSGPG